MMYPLILAALIQYPVLGPTIDFVDSRDDSKMTYIIVNDTCKVKIKKSDLNDYDAIIDIVMKKCGL